MTNIGRRGGGEGKLEEKINISVVDPFYCRGPIGTIQSAKQIRKDLTS